MAKLGELVRVLPSARWRGDLGVEVQGIAFDSRSVQPGDLFVAIRGQHHDGARFAPEAVQRGAVAVVAQVDLPELTVPLIMVPNARLALPLLSSALYGYPARHLGMIGVTGTDGKTTTVHLVSALLEAGGHRTGIVSTVDIKIGDEFFPNDSEHTTPESPVLQAWLARMREAGADYAVVETSSHALAQGRVEACEFDVGIFTNLSREHLNYHGSLLSYRWDKARLFSMLGESIPKGLRKAGIINIDDPHARFFQAVCPVEIVTYGVERAADVRATDVEELPDGLRFRVQARGKSVEIRTILAGRFNVYNWLAAIAAVLTQGVSLERIAEVAPKVPPVPGRLQWVQVGQPFAVVVDFAHTPRALEMALKAVRRFISGRVIAVFGHAGGRDVQNRPLMGAVAAREADFFIITTDDPCDEDPEEIARAVARGASEAGAVENEDYLCVLDRREAFREAFRRAGSGDLVLLAGRGHERFMPVGHLKIPFNDAEVAKELLQEMFGQHGISS